MKNLLVQELKAGIDLRFLNRFYFMIQIFTSDGHITEIVYFAINFFCS